jgi:FAD/FMN-containing dehydrogenase
MKMQAVTNWGNYPKVQANMYSSEFVDEISKIIKNSDQIIARGNGRCYGDASLGKNIISCLELDKFLSFDKNKGILQCQSGVLLSDILEFIVPLGFFLPVTPGTKFITIGGAIASDVHGKNHHVDGCFSEHILELSLINEKGQIIRCSSTHYEELFYNTVGGMGRTGVIVDATIQLKSIETSYIKYEYQKVSNLEEMMHAFDDSIHWTYSVAWLDVLKGGKDMGRGILMKGEHAKLNEIDNSISNKPLRTHSNKTINIPFYLPSFVLNDFTVKTFNFLYYNKQRKKVKKGVAHYDGFFYPLDAILNWNRCYGKSGFTQYQFVLPKETSYEGLKAFLRKLRNSKNFSSFLVVLKLFGKTNPNAVWSFPKEGYTLALDIKIKEGIQELIDEFDEIIKSFGGNIYLTKDAFSSRKMFQLPEDSQSKFISLQMNRLNH